MNTYVFMLNPDDPDYWRCYAWGESPEEIINRGTCYEEFTVLKSEYTGEYIQDTKLKNATTGETVEGKIFQLTPVPKEIEHQKATIMKPYIFVLNNNDPFYWRYYAEGNSPEEIIAHGTYYNESSVLKSEHTGTYIQGATLKNATTGGAANGEIYQLSAAVNPAKKKATPAGKGNMLVLALLLSSLFLLGACDSSRNLTGRYKTTSESGMADISPLVTVQGYALPVPASPRTKTPPVTPMALDPKVQKELVQKIEAHEPNPEKMIKLLGTKVIEEEKDEPSPFVNRTLFSKRLVLSVRNKSALPENRISKLEVTVSNTDPNLIRFKGCDKIVTELQTVDQGKLTFKNTLNGEVTAGANIGGTGSIKQNYKTVNANGDTVIVESNGGTSNSASASGKLGFSNESYEEANLKQRYVSLTAGIGQTSASFYQETVAGIDLSGNIIADIQFELLPNAQITETRFSFGKLFDASGAVSPNASVTVSRKYVTVPQPGHLLLTNDLTLKVTYDAVFRKVTSGGKTLIEGDDKVEYISGKGTATEEFVLLSKEEMVSHKWSLTDNAGHQLAIPDPLSGMAQTLYFDSYSSAAEFIYWVKKSLTSMQPFTREGIVLSLNGSALTSGVIAQLKLKVD